MVAIAHVGHGYWGRNLARNFAELGHLRAIVDSDAAAAAKAAETYGVKALGFDEALKSDAIEAISIASPAELHYAQAKAALEAGKHVYVEKPVALDIAEAEKLCELSETCGRVLMVGHLLQYHPVYIKLREMVAAGELGTLRYIYSNRLSLGKFRTEENVLWSFAPHDISMILGLVGSEPDKIAAQGTIAVTPGIADFVTMEMSFKEGPKAHVMTSWMHPFKEQRLVVIGDKAMAVFEDSKPEWDDKLTLYRSRIKTDGPVPVPEKGNAEPIAVARAEPLKEECRHFADCIEKGTRPRTDGREGLAVLKVLDGAERAMAAY